MIGEAIGGTLALGVGVALSPLAVVAVVVMLLAPSGGAPAWAFAAGWVASLTAVATVAAVLAEEADAADDGGPATWVGVAKLVLGVLLVLVAIRQWTRRPRDGADPEAPGWLRRLDGVTVPRAAGLAVLFNVAKPKNLLLAVAAGIAVAQAGAGPAATAAAIAVFALLGTAGVGLPLAVHVLMPDRGRGVLQAIRDWMVRENATIIVVLLLVIAATLLGDAVSGLTS